MSDILKILILEDSADDAEMVLRVLDKSNLSFESVLVMNREDYLTALDQFKPELILSDNSMPQFSATEALEILHQQGLHIPLILVTGTVSEEFAANIIKLGADDYILKDRLTRLPAAINATMEKKRSEAAIRVKEEELRFKASLLAAVGQAVIVTDIGGEIIYWNAAAEKNYGWTEAEAIGKNIVELVPSKQTREQANEIMQQLRNGDSWSGEFLVQRKDGTEFMAFVTDSPIYDNNGKLSGVIGVSTDISERKNAEQELKIMEAQILNQKIAEQKKVTRAIITAQEQERNHIGQELHDNVAQILAGTRLFLEVAAKKNAIFMELVKYPLELIENSIDELRALSSKNVTPLRNINLQELIQIVVNNLHKTTAMKIDFAYQLQTPLSDDGLKLNIYRIVQEQLNNIIKHSRAQNVLIKIEAEGNFINLEIKDDGKGFDISQKRKGIGISNMLNRVESFNGKMTLETSAGNGCRVQVSMPMKA